METLYEGKLIPQIVNACLEAKGRDIVILDMREISGITDYFIIASGRSDRQVQGISNRVIDSLQNSKTKPVAVEGLERGQWAVLDYGDIMVHVFNEAVRSTYDLESFWARAPKSIVETNSDGTLKFHEAA